MRITFITGHLCKERHALLHELAIDLGKNGAQVTVLTGYPSRRISEEVKNFYLAHPVERISENVIVKRIGSRSGEGKGLFERMIKYLFLTNELYREAKKTPTDAYYIYSSPPFLGWMGTKLTKYAPTLYNAQDLFPDTLLRIKKIKESNLIIKYFRHREKKTYQKNTKIVTISEEMKKTIISHGCPTNKVDVIYNWADIENLHHIDRNDNALMDELGINKNDFIVSYAGDIGLFQGWPIIVEAAKRVHKENKDIKFVFIGSGSYKQKLEKTINEENLDYISTYPLQPSSRLSEIYSIGDLELVSIEPGLSKIALPSKMFVIMATGSPLLSLVDQNSDIARLIKERDTGYTLELKDSDELAKTIIEAYNDRIHLPKKGKNARELSEEIASREIQTYKYYLALKSMVEIE